MYKNTKSQTKLIATESKMRHMQRIEWTGEYVNGDVARYIPKLINLDMFDDVHIS